MENVHRIKRRVEVHFTFSLRTLTAPLWSLLSLPPLHSYEIKRLFLKHVGFHGLSACSAVSNLEGRTAPGYSHLALHSNMADNANGSKGKESLMAS